jgi:hypothetical protein
VRQVVSVWRVISGNSEGQPWCRGNRCSVRPYSFVGSVRENPGGPVASGNAGPSATILRTVVPYIGQRSPFAHSCIRRTGCRQLASPNRQTIRNKSVSGTTIVASSTRKHRSSGYYKLSSMESQAERSRVSFTAGRRTQFCSHIRIVWKNSRRFGRPRHPTRGTS